MKTCPRTGRPGVAENVCRPDHLLLPESRLNREADRKISTRAAAAALLGLDLTSIDGDQIDAAVGLLARQPLARERARRIALCPPPCGPREPYWSRACRLRACPRCADRRARSLATRMIEVASEFGHRAAALITCPSRTLHDLPDARGRLGLAIREAAPPPLVPAHRRWRRAGYRVPPDGGWASLGGSCACDPPPCRS